MAVFFPLSLRMVEDMLAARGIIVTHQTIRTWAEKFGRHFANQIRRRSAGRLGDKWHLDEVVVSVAGTKHWLWRAVDQDGFAPPDQLPARDWLVALLASRQPLSIADRMALLSGRSPVPMPAVGRIICSCFNVGINQLASAVAAGCHSVEAIGAELRAGTNCGSCRSEIRSIIDAGRIQAAE